ncbi:protein of unknown function [Micropruina glycogenica]|uniref:Uncharacterized protein n=1 Tax=Micropruina glycogenica TaxID=75385 RepID=A0A2N9JG00_9ACTN|nr:protein of unknown function [Micropruina glycogenica]
MSGSRPERMRSRHPGGRRDLRRCALHRHRSHGTRVVSHDWARGVTLVPVLEFWGF